MANIARFDPFRDIDDLFRRALRPVRWEGDGEPCRSRWTSRRMTRPTSSRPKCPA